MFKSRVSQILLACLCIFSGPVKADQSSMIVKYPDFPELSISVPSTCEIYNKERYGLFSDDNKLEIAGTAYKSKGNEVSAKKFAEMRVSSIPDDMPWYKEVTELKELKGLGEGAYVIEYEGIWPNESDPTSYIVVMAKNESILLSLTFTAFTKDMDSKRSVIDSIIKSVSFDSK